MRSAIKPQRGDESPEKITYVGYRRRGQPVVQRLPGGRELSPERSHELRNHSPGGFEWGYNGSGPGQLALAILLDYTNDEAVALEHYIRFNNEIVSRLDCAEAADRWVLPAAVIEEFLRGTDEEVTRD